MRKSGLIRIGDRGDRDGKKKPLIHQFMTAESSGFRLFAGASSRNLLIEKERYPRFFFVFATGSKEESSHAAGFVTARNARRISRSIPPRTPPSLPGLSIFYAIGVAHCFRGRVAAPLARPKGCSATASQG
jgi:hypothetical protein